MTRRKKSIQTRRGFNRFDQRFAVQQRQNQTALRYGRASRQFAEKADCFCKFNRRKRWNYFRRRDRLIADEARRYYFASSGV